MLEPSSRSVMAYTSANPTADRPPEMVEVVEIHGRFSSLKPRGVFAVGVDAHGYDWYMGGVACEAMSPAEKPDQVGGRKFYGP